MKPLSHIFLIVKLIKYSYSLVRRDELSSHAVSCVCRSDALHFTHIRNHRYSVFRLYPL